MATDALDVLSLALLKDELRIPQSEVPRTMLYLTGSAMSPLRVAFVEKYLSFPLLCLIALRAFRCFRPGDSGGSNCAYLLTNVLSGRNPR